MGLEEYKGVYVFAQQVDHQLSRISFELLGKARELASDLGTDVTAVLIGSGVRQMADELAEYGADRVIVVDNPVLKEYMTEPYAHALSSVINKYKPEIVLVGATAIGRDLGPRVSARVATGLTADCILWMPGSWYQEAGGLAVRRILPCWRNWLTHWAGRSAAHGQWWMQAGNQRICRWDRPVRRSGQLYILPSVSPVRSSTWPEWRSQIS